MFAGLNLAAPTTPEKHLTQVDPFSKPSALADFDSKNQMAVGPPLTLGNEQMQQPQVPTYESKQAIK